MAHMVASQAGDTAVGSTWVGGVPPADGDTCESVYDLTVATTQTIGTAPASLGSVITLNGSAALTIRDGGVLTVRGGLDTEDGDLVVEAGGEIVCEKASGIEYRFLLGAIAGDTGRFICAGVLGNRAIVRGSGDGVFQIRSQYGTSSDDIAVELSFADVIGVGDGSNYSFMWRNSIRVYRCIMDGCGRMYQASARDSANFDYRDSTWKNSVNSSVILSQRGSGDPGVTRRIDHCFFDRGFIIQNMDVVETHLVQPLTYSTSEYVSIFESNLCWGINHRFESAPIIDSNFFFAPSSQSNPHNLLPSNDRSQIIRGNIFEYGGASDAGDCLLAQNASAPITCTVENNIVLKNSAGISSGTLMTMLGNDDFDVIIRNNTYRGESPVVIGETTATHAGMVEELQNNLVIGNGAAGTNMLEPFVPSTPVVDGAITVADHNAGFGLEEHYSSNLEESDFGTPPGTGDIEDVDPEFVDYDRDIAAWVRHALGQAGTDQEMQDYAALAFANMNDEDSIYYHDGIRPSELIEWVRAGHVPTNMDLATSGFGGTFIGALLPEAADSEWGVSVNPVVLATPAGAWERVAQDVLGVAITPLNVAPSYLITHRLTGDPAPTDLADAVPLKSVQEFTDSSDVYVYAHGIDGRVRIDE